MDELSKYKDLLTVNDLAEIFGVSKTTIYKEINKGKFGVPISIGRTLKFPRFIIRKRFFTDSN